MFATSQPPPKEGRRLPLRQSMRSPILMLAALCVLLVILKSTSSRSGSIQPEVPQNEVNKKQDPLEETPPKLRQYRGRLQSSSQKPSATTDFHHGHDSGHKKQAVLSGDGGSSKTQAKHHELERLLDRVLRLLPDELESEYILHQVHKLDVEPDVHVLKALGLLARKYNKLFTAWEELHLVQDSDGIHIHDDVVQTLRQHTANNRSVDGQVAYTSGLAGRIQSYEAYRQLVTTLGRSLFPWTSPYHTDHMALHLSMNKGGRGIVITAGNDQVPYILTSIPIFRKLGCTLPIEVMYAGDSDIKPELRSMLDALDGVVTRDMSRMVTTKGWTLLGWQAKPFAMLLSSFREIIFIDADCLFFKNPELLFQDADYKRTGALFFRDRLIAPQSRQEWLRDLLPRPISQKVQKSTMWTGASGHMQESGVIVVDKWRHFMALLLVSHLNGPVSKAMYDEVYGDKETFWLGWELLGDADYAFHQGAVGGMGIIEEARSEKEDKDDDDDDDDEAKEKKKDKDITGMICSPQLLHMDLDETPFWFNGWIGKNKFEEKLVHSKASLPFEHYLRESTDPHKYEIGDSNTVCLTESERKPKPLSAQEKQVLRMMYDKAVEVGTAIKEAGMD